MNYLADGEVGRAVDEEAFWLEMATVEGRGKGEGRVIYLLTY